MRYSEMRRTMPKSTPEFIEFHIDLFIDADIPGEMVNIIECIAGTRTFDSNTKLPGHEYFDELDWHDWFRYTAKQSAVLPRFDFIPPRLSIAGCHPNALNRIHSLLHWLMDYICGPRTLGSFRRRGDIFPATIHVDKGRVGVTEVNQILGRKGIFLIEPSKKRIAEFSKGITFDDVMRIVDPHEKTSLH